jgi:3',5'-nucleoside bisphosphate phosphatase
MKRLLFVALLAVFGISVVAAQSVYVTPIRIPDVADYRTLKCDLHMHTVFSDGQIWPDFRVTEAVCEGLDAIAITDHLEYLPKKAYIGGDRNTSFRLASDVARNAGLIVIPGAEITRSMPPGHLNALFIQDANKLVTDKWRDAVAEARNQGAIIFWNHPGWKGQQADGVARWYDEHTELLQNGSLWGMEVVNHTDYYPDVLAWCREKGLCITGNSDTHEPIAYEFVKRGIAHRPMTLVFAREKSAEAIKEAMLAKRTAVYYENQIIGDEIWLRGIFDRSVTITPGAIVTFGRKGVTLSAVNTSDLAYRLVRVAASDVLNFPEELDLHPGQTTLFSVRPVADTLSVAKDVTVRYAVKNMIIAPGKNLEVPLTFSVRIEPKK